MSDLLSIGPYDLRLTAQAIHDDQSAIFRCSPQVGISAPRQSAARWKCGLQTSRRQRQRGTPTRQVGCNRRGIHARDCADPKTCKQNDVDVVSGHIRVRHDRGSIFSVYRNFDTAGRFRRTIGDLSLVLSQSGASCHNCRSSVEEVPEDTFCQSAGRKNSSRDSDCQPDIGRSLLDYCNHWRNWWATDFQEYSFYRREYRLARNDRDGLDCVSAVLARVGSKAPALLNLILCGGRCAAFSHAHDR